MFTQNHLNINKYMRKRGRPSKKIQTTEQLDMELDELLEKDDELLEYKKNADTSIPKIDCTLENLEQALMDLITRHSNGTPNNNGSHVKDSDMIRAAEVLIKVKILEKTNTKELPPEIHLDF